MMVSPEMVEAAARADASYAGRTFDALASSDKVRFTERAKLMLEAALSTDAEPVAIYKGNGLVDCGDSGHHNIELLKLIPANTPLYADPVKTAPAVAVKAIEAVWIKHDGKSMPVNAETVVEVRMAGGFEHEEDLAGNWLEREGSKSNWHHDLGCPHPCDIVAYRIVKGSPALSAQVQDVAGWQSMDSAPKDGKHCLLAVRSSCFVYAVQGAFMSGKWENAAGLGSEPLCWMPLTRIPLVYLPWTKEFSAATAASKHGDAE